jgi:hypothetical protein
MAAKWAFLDDPSSRTDHSPPGASWRAVAGSLMRWFARAVTMGAASLPRDVEGRQRDHGVISDRLR